MTEIALPPEFKKACRNLGQNIGYEQPSMEVIVNYALSNLDRNDAAVIRKFLDDELLSGRRDDRALMETWWSTPASIYFHDGQELRRFLRLLREALGRPPYVDAR
jgi:hypothetical protein